MAGTTEMDGLLRDLRDHVTRFGGLQWMREHTDGADDLMAKSGEPLADHLERIRAAVREDIGARVEAAWASWAAWASLAGWPLYEDGEPVSVGDVVCLADARPGGAGPVAVTGVEILSGGRATLREGARASLEVAPGARVRPATPAEMACGIARLALRDGPSDPDGALPVVGAYALALERSLGGGGDDGGR